MKIPLEAAMFLYLYMYGFVLVITGINEWTDRENEH